MSKYIKRKDAIEAVRKAYVDYIPILYGRTQEIPLKVDMALTSIPSADVIEHERGEWVDISEWYTPRQKCSICETVVDGYGSNFCPNCGADMRGKDDE